VKVIGPASSFLPWPADLLQNDSSADQLKLLPG
jgi:hypothetical protein